LVTLTTQKKNKFRDSMRRSLDVVDRNISSWKKSVYVPKNIFHNQNPAPILSSIIMAHEDKLKIEKGKNGIYSLVKPRKSKAHKVFHTKKEIIERYSHKQ
jgi:hypothetical protein